MKKEKSPTTTKKPYKTASTDTANNTVETSENTQPETKKVRRTYFNSGSGWAL